MNTAAAPRGRWAFRLPFGLCLFAIEQLGRREDRLADNFSGDSPLPGKVLLKGTKILSPFSDTEEVVLRVARDFVPTADELGRRTLTPHEIRDWLEAL